MSAGAGHAVVGVVGARSPLGERVIGELRGAGSRVVAYSRRPIADSVDGVSWRRLPAAEAAMPERPEPPIASWVFVAHIWLLPDYFTLLESSGARRIVAVSSTSQFTKTASSSPADRETAARLARAEAAVRAWSQRSGVAVTILRPTLIYGGGSDRNISEVARFIARTGFFPLLGQAKGLRQPVHVADVAAACAAALQAGAAAGCDYEISGGEVLSYRAMVERVFEAMGRPIRLVPLPVWAIKAGVGAARMLPRFRHWTVGMAERMDQDMVFDHAAAARDFGFAPRPFMLERADVLLPDSPST